MFSDECIVLELLLLLPKGWLVLYLYRAIIFAGDDGHHKMQDADLEKQSKENLVFFRNKHVHVGIKA